MKAALLFPILAWSVCGQAPAQDILASPTVEADRKVTFRIRAPKASDVSIYGDWMPLGSADELKPLSGKNVSGTLKSIDADNIVLQTDTGPVATPLSQVLAVDLKPIRAVDAKVYEIRLIDDSVLAVREIAYAGKDVQVTLLSGAAITPG